MASVAGDGEFGLILADGGQERELTGGDVDVPDVLGAVADAKRGRGGDLRQRLSGRKDDSATIGGPARNPVRARLPLAGGVQQDLFAAGEVADGQARVAAVGIGNQDETLAIGRKRAAASVAAED